MVDLDNVFFNIASFIGGLFVLEFGADTFIDHTAKVASRLGVSPTLIALLTAGAEWEELVVVVAAISQKQSSLALGNILGSSISNILGAFSLGLMFSPIDVVFDRSSKIYTALLLAITSAFVLLLPAFQSLGRAGGAVLVVAFVLYFISVGYFIYTGKLSPPEDDDSDSDSDGDSDNAGASDSDSDDEGERGNNERDPLHSSSSTRSDIEAAAHEDMDVVDIRKNSKSFPQKIQKQHRPPHSLFYHIIYLVLGFLALSLSGYILSHSVSTIAETFSLSGNLLGITILSFATTLPEKLVAIFSGARKQSGIVVASTAGSNIFLLTLCAGILFLAGDLEVLGRGVSTFDAISLWASSLLLFIIVMSKGQKWMGYGLFGLYVVFIAIEFVLYRE